MKRQFKLSVMVAALMLAQTGLAASAQTSNYAPWLTQIGITNAIESAANWGTGLILGVVDTGIVADNQMFAPGQVSLTQSQCSISTGCPDGFVDDNSHGTAVASIAAGNTPSPYTFYTGAYWVTAGQFIGAAPNANIIAEKVLNAQGSGYSTDVASGIVQAADSGVSVINVSITYGNTADLVSAINYAASKGVFIVWAGGNSSQALLGGASTLGLTATAISHLVFVGSVNSANTKSSFSNTPGTGKLVNTSGQATNYSSRWIMAPGEAILAPYATAGALDWAAWSGTSMSTPIISGVLLLLEDAWPILKTNGTAANLLLATTTDLGARGVDRIYGTGLANLGKAFSPYGTLTVTNANGATVAVKSLNKRLISGGALGSLDTVKSLLANYTAFDGYSRNFSVNLSGLIATRPTAYSLNPLPANTNTGPNKISLADGTDVVSDNFTDGSRMTAIRSPDGSAVAMGFGTSPQFAYAQALYENPALAELSYIEGDAAGFAPLVQGGTALAYGANLADDLRIAVMYSENAPLAQTIDGQALTAGTTQNAASNLSVGASRKLASDLVATLTVGLIKEQNGLLGADSTGPGLGFGTGLTHTVGLSLGYAINNRVSLLGEAGMGYSKATGSGLLGGTGNVVSQAFGLSLLAHDVAKESDRLTLSIKQPLRVVSGQTTLVTAGVAADGTPQFNSTPVSLVPDGREIDLHVGYAVPVGKLQSISFYATEMKDALNIAGNHVHALGATWSGHF